MLKTTFDIKKNIYKHLELYIQSTKARPSSANGDQGFTLVELLIATAIMTFVVALAGTGLVAMLNKHKNTESDTQRRANLNRALDYIANSVRMSNTVLPINVLPINNPTPSPTPSPIPSAITTALPTDATAILSVGIPSETTSPTPYPTHVYYIRPVNTSCTASPAAGPVNTIWASPNMICRRRIKSDGTPLVPDDLLVDGVNNNGFTASVNSSGQVTLTLEGTTWEGVGTSGATSTSGRISVTTTAVKRVK